MSDGPLVPGEEPPVSDEALVELVEDQRNLLIAVATGTSITSDLELEYARRRRRIASALGKRSISDPMRWPDLRQFWASVAAPTMSTYRERRAHIHEIAGELIEKLEQRRRGESMEDWGTSLEDWANLDGRVDGLRRTLSTAEELDDWQDVGRRCREILIDLANLLYEPGMAEPEPKGSDAKTKLDAWLATRIPGPSMSEIRRLINAAWDLAVKVLHGDADRRHAFAAAQATVVVVRTAAVIEAEA